VVTLVNHSPIFCAHLLPLIFEKSEFVINIPHNIERIMTCLAPSPGTYAALGSLINACAQHSDVFEQLFPAFAMVVCSAFQFEIPALAILSLCCFVGHVAI
jgi:hypothetical protein